MHPSLDFWSVRVSRISTYWPLGQYDMETRQNLPFASNARNPFERAFDYLWRIIDISNQFLDERGEWICSVKTETLLKAS